jgi:hypothetical protein
VAVHARRLQLALGRAHKGEGMSHPDTRQDLLNAWARWGVTHDPKWLRLIRAIRYHERYWECL